MNPFLIAGLLGAGAGFLSRDKKKSRKKMARGGKTHSLKFQKVDFPALEGEGIQRHKAQGDEYIFVIDEYVTSDSKEEYGDAEFGGNVHLYVRDKDGKEVDFVRFLDDYDDAVGFANYQNSGLIGIGSARYAKGGTTSDAEERAFAEYMEDYGVDREEAEEQFLGEFDNKGEWAAEFVDDIGGMESLIDPERFYRIDKVGFREWAINMADSMVMDIDEDNVEEYAERHNLEDEFEIAEAKEERYPNKTDGYGHMDRFVEKVKEEEHESIVYVFEAENRDAQEVIANIGSDYGMSLDDLERAYLIIPDYDEVADALEDDGYVFIEEDFKTFVFNSNMARGGRTKRMKKGGKVKGLDKYGSWYYMDDDGTLFVRAQEMGQDKAPKWDEDDDGWGVVDSRAFGTMERQEFDRDMKKLFGRKPKLG